MSAPQDQWPRLMRIAEQAARDLDGAPPLDVLRWASDTFDDRLCVSSSMTDAVLAHLAGRARPGVPVFFLDTGYHFAETIGTRDAVAATLPVDVRTVLPLWTVAEQDADLLPRLHERDPDRCCWLRKVEPLGRALEPFSAWVSGVRRDESPTRADTPVVTWDARRASSRCTRWPAGPRTTWMPTSSSTTCWSTRWSTTATRRSAASPARPGSRPGADPRSGRWAGRTKTECGIHV